jgi:hypothetical protein
MCEKMLERWRLEDGEFAWGVGEMEMVGDRDGIENSERD